MHAGRSDRLVCRRPSRRFALVGGPRAARLSGAQWLGPPARARLEFLFTNLLQHIRPARALDEALRTDPALFAEILSYVYWGKDAPRPGRAAGTQNSCRGRVRRDPLLAHAARRPPGRDRRYRR